MEELSIIDLRISNITQLGLDEQSNLQGLIEKFDKELNGLVIYAKEIEIWQNKILKLVFTDRYEEDVEKQALEWNLKVKLTSDREIKSVTKILSNNYAEKEEVIIFFSLQILKLEDLFHKIIIQQILRVHIDEILEKNILVQDENQLINPSSLIDYIFNSISFWIPEVYSVIFMKTIFKSDKSILDENKLFNEFCRKLKRSLFDYNSDEKDNEFRIDRFWRNTNNNFKHLINNFIEIYIKNGSIDIKDDFFRKIVIEILESLLKIKAEIDKQNTFDISDLKSNIVAFYRLFDIKLEEYETNFFIRFDKNPKDYFLDRLVDTEPRIVCFLDILGFSDMIEEYENDLASSILQDIQIALEDSLTILKLNEDEKSTEVLKYLKYQLFSDCISISLPYFDNEEDFINNFNLISTFTNGFQYNLMSKGFFVRGGISIGSFYSNDHIIFSKGLVEAYKLESKKAIFPRVLIDEKIISKLKKYDYSRIIYYGVNTYIVKDHENIVFLNPFKIVSELGSQIARIKEAAKVVDEDDQDFANTINNILDLTFSLLDEQVDQVTSTSQDQLDVIHEHIVINIDRFLKEKKDKELTKYIWIQELLKWSENKELSTMKFENIF